MPRRTALEALMRVRREAAWSRPALASQAEKNGLDRRDRALAARLFYGVLQNRTWLDFLLDQYVKGKLEPVVRDILRLGACQLLLLDRIPDRAAVDESVRLCRSHGYDRAAGLVNAVLRRLGENRDHLPEVPGKGTCQYLSIRYSHPLWMVEELTALRGYEGAEAVLAADNCQAPLYLQVNTCRTTFQDLAQQLPVLDTPAGPALAEPEGFPDTAAFRQGLFYIQDPAAHAVVEAAGLKPGMSVLDVCAAPGGKSFAAAIAMGDQGQVVARDILEKKLKLVREGAGRLGLKSIVCQCLDVRSTPRVGCFDVVLADLPCSGLGVIRRKPEIRYRPEEELASLPDLQEELLDSAAGAVRPGGKLLYSTCTWRPGENSGVTARFLREHRDFTTTWERTYWPDLDGTDGFYLCRMDRSDKT